MRILFFLGYPGYLRYYDSTIKLLAERGHEVLVTFEQPGKQREGLRALDDAPPGVTVLEQPEPRPTTWEFIPREVRRVVDFVRYLDPRFADAAYLRRRQAETMLAPFKRFKDMDALDERKSRLLMRCAQSFEHAIPSFPNIEQYLRELAPDVLVVTPLVTSVTRQADYVKSARALGIPTVLGVASWDHLTSKGIIRVMPDRVIVWNEVQRREAEELHGVPPDRIAVTGAQPWDRWFSRSPTFSANEYRRIVGLPEDLPFVLFVGSTASISRPEAEVEFVREWLGGLREHGDPRLSGMGVVMRPHPYNMGLWGDADLSEFGNAVVFPREGANPVDEDDRAIYFDSMYHAEGVVGINTSAMMESAIVGTPVFTIRSPRFVDSQGGTVHFNYLLPENGGFVQEADSLPRHLDQLSAVLDEPESARRQLDDFVNRFIRPYGRERPATPLICDEIEYTAAGAHPRPPRVVARLHPQRVLLWSLSAGHLMRNRRSMSAGFAHLARWTGHTADRRADAIARSSATAANVFFNVDRSITRNGPGPLARVGTAVQLGGTATEGTLRRVGARSEFDLKRISRRLRESAIRRTRAEKARAAQRAAEAADVAQTAGKIPTEGATR